MKATELITKAKVNLILNHPFFATIMLGLKFNENKEIQTAFTDGKQLAYNPQFIESLNLAKTVGLIAHECLHVSYLHHTRKGARDIKKWNIAADFAINQLLIDSGFSLPEGGCIDKQYKDLSAEEIYSKLPDMPPDKDQKEDQNNDEGGNGGVEQPKAQTQGELNQIEAETKQLVAQAAQIAKQQGKLPAHLQRLVNELLEPKVNWKDLLNNFLTEITKNDYTFKKPNKRYISRGLYLPSLESIEKGKFVLIIDTSGSVDEKLLSDFVSEMQGILNDCANSITVYHVDTEIQRIEEIQSDEQIDIQQIYGGGGTDFKPAFDHIEKNGIETAAIVYFTDGYCNSFPQELNIPTLWAIYDNKSFKEPFGQTIHLSQN